VVHPDPGPSDPILDSPWTLHPDFASEVRRWIDFWTGQEGAWFPIYLDRMSVYADLVDEALARRGLPSSLRYLPLIESGYAPTAVSRVAAVGLWQLMGPTARSSGIRVGSLVDERRDPVLATEVATAYLEELYARFGSSWFMALAAYNAGPARVSRVLEEHAPGEPLSDDLFWKIREHLPRETRDFIPRLVAAAHVAARPSLYGVEAPPPREPWAWDTVAVPDATSLDVVAEAAGVEEGQVVSLNPQIVRRVTPRGTRTVLRVPPGTGARFRIEYPKVPQDERITVTEHVVVRGETLWGISRQYGVPLDVIEEANPSVRPERLMPGDRLVVPRRPSARGSR
jgi:membrane-bound lytic murein transglycosylase D